MWQTKIKPLQSCRVLRLRRYCSTKTTAAEARTSAHGFDSSTLQTTTAVPETNVPSTIDASNYINAIPKTVSSIVMADKQTNSFDDIPGPVSLRLISKFWGMIPVVGTELTVSVVQYLLSGGHFFGDLLSWGGNMPFFKKFFNIYGPVVRLHGAFGSDVVLISRPEHASAIFSFEGPYPVRSCLDCVEKYRLESRKYQQAGPFLMYGSDWQKLRSAIETPLKTSIEQQFTQIETICDEFIKMIIVIRNLQEEMPNSFKKDIYKWSLECLTSVTLNRKLGFLDDSGLSPTSDPGKLLEGLIGATDAIRKCEYGFHLWKFIETPSWKSLVKHCDIIDSVLNKNLQQAIKTLKDKNDNKLESSQSSLLQGLVNNDDIKEEDIMTILLDMFLIGVNATTHTAAFLIYHLARNPRTQIKLHEEIKNNKPLTKDVLKKMEYLQACIKECLRLSPPIPILTRILNNDVVLHNYKIPKGTHVLYAAHLNTMCEEYYEDAQKFKPERWLSNELGGFGNEYQAFASIPFGYGLRACVAKDMAEMQIAMLLYKVCEKFKIEYNYGDIKSSNQLLAAPTKPLKFRFINRV